jgi:hypothetical protein
MLGIKKKLRDKVFIILKDSPSTQYIYIYIYIKDEVFIQKNSLPPNMLKNNY